MEFGKDQKEQGHSLTPVNCSGSVLRGKSEAPGIYTVTLKNLQDNRLSVLYVAAINSESAALRALEVAPSKLQMTTPEIINVIFSYQ